MCKYRLYTKKSFDNDFLDFCPECFDIMTHFFELLLLLKNIYKNYSEHCLQTSLVSYIIFIGIFIKNEIWIVLVNGIICEMHADIIQIVKIGRTIRFCSKSSQAIMIQINSKRIAASKQHIKTQVKLKPINQKWLVKVTLCNVVFTRLDIFPISSEEDASAL